MRKKAPKKKQRSLQDILDSDDEIPTEYIDLPFVPAYQVDNRFECTKEEEDKQGKEQFGSHFWLGLSFGEAVTALKCFSKKNTFCFLCVEPYADIKTQMWFFAFLMSKEVQAKYTFLTTCLVLDNSSANRKSFKECNENSRYKMVACK